MCPSNNINLCLPRAARGDTLGFMHSRFLTLVLLLLPLLLIHLSNQWDVTWNALRLSIPPSHYHWSLLQVHFSLTATSRREKKNLHDPNYHLLKPKKIPSGMETGTSAGSLMGRLDERSNSSSISSARHCGDKFSAPLALGGGCPVLDD